MEIVFKINDSFVMGIASGLVVWLIQAITKKLSKPVGKSRKLNRN